MNIKTLSKYCYILIIVRNLIINDISIVFENFNENYCLPTVRYHLHNSASSTSLAL